MAPSKGRVIKKRFALPCFPPTLLYSGIARKAVSKVSTQGQIVCDIALYPPPTEAWRCEEAIRAWTRGR